MEFWKSIKRGWPAALISCCLVFGLIYGCHLVFGVDPIVGDSPNAVVIPGDNAYCIVNLSVDGAPLEPLELYEALEFCYQVHTDNNLPRITIN